MELVVPVKGGQYSFENEVVVERPVRHGLDLLLRGDILCLSKSKKAHTLRPKNGRFVGPPPRDHSDCCIAWFSAFVQKYHPAGPRTKQCGRKVSGPIHKMEIDFSFKHARSLTSFGHSPPKPSSGAGTSLNRSATRTCHTCVAVFDSLLCWSTGDANRYPVSTRILFWLRLFGRLLTPLGHYVSSFVVISSASVHGTLYHATESESLREQ
jgi:hypothetical protein